MERDCGRVASEAERGRAVLSLGILASRWVSLGWMVVLALTAGELRRPALAVAMIPGRGRVDGLADGDPAPSDPGRRDAELRARRRGRRPGRAPAERSASQLQAATDETIRARERAARLAERESLARQIHDWVLQAWPLSTSAAASWPPAARSPPTRWPGWPRWPPARTALRSLILRDPEDEHAPGRTPAGAASLRAALEALAGGEGPCRSPPGPPAPCGGRRGRSRGCPRPSARPSTRWSSTRRLPGALFAEEDGGAVVLTVPRRRPRFAYDERRLLAEGKIGLAKSVKGRVGQLGGGMLVTSRPGAGTEIEPGSPPGPPRE